MTEQPEDFTFAVISGGNSYYTVVSVPLTEFRLAWETVGELSIGKPLTHILRINTL